jgi:5-methylthioadenosine/S-adenosylhomocysteine deaminase
MMIFEADWLCPASGEPIRNGAIAVEHGRIREVGPASGMQGPRTAFKGCAIIPGFVNAHTHLELTLLRGFLENGSFLDWIQTLVRTKYQVLSPEELKVSAQLGALEMLQAGVTAVGEVMDVGTGLEAMVEFGLQGVAYQEVFGPADAVAENSLRGLREKLDYCRKHETATLKVGVSPHAPYSVSKTLYQLTGEYARRNGLLMAAHIAESPLETDFVKDGTGPFAQAFLSRGIDVVPRGQHPVAYLDSLGLLGPDMLLIHAIEIDDGDLQRIAATGATVVHCPKSNAKLGHDIARVSDMRCSGIPVSLGTDSVASNNVVDMFEEMRTAVFFQRILTGKVQALSAADVFRMATIDAALCLRLDKELGSLDPQKRADFAVVDLSTAATQPVYDPIETMVYSASRGNIKATYIGGNPVALDASPLLREAAAIAAKLQGA